MNHIEQTLAELRHKRDAINTLIAGLESHFVAAIASPAEQQKPDNVQPTKPKRKTSPAPRADTQRLVAIVQKLKEPFRADDIAQAAGISLKAAQSTIYRWKEKGWVTPGPTFGTHQRTKTFGGASAAGTALLAEIHREIDAAKPKDD